MIRYLERDSSVARVLRSQIIQRLPGSLGCPKDARRKEPPDSLS